MIQEDNPYLAIVFCNKREGAIRLSYELTAAGLNIAEMHGDLTQGRRTQILRDFDQGKNTNFGGYRYCSARHRY